MSVKKVTISDQISQKYAYLFLIGQNKVTLLILMTSLMTTANPNEVTIFSANDEEVVIITSNGYHINVITSGLTILPEMYCSKVIF